MPKSKEPVFRDFCLVEFSHMASLDRKKLDALIKSTKECLELAKEAVRDKTRPGDLVMIETPKHFTYSDWLAVSGRKDNSKAKRVWRRWAHLHFNAYYFLSKYARSIGRKVESLEPTPTEGATKFMKMVRRKLGPEDTIRMKYLEGPRRDDFFQHRIQRREPKMVVTAMGHAIPLEVAMEPKKRIWLSRPLLTPPQKFAFIFGHELLRTQMQTLREQRAKERSIVKRRPKTQAEKRTRK